MRPLFLVFCLVCALPSAALAQEDKDPFDDLLQDDEDESFGKDPEDPELKKKRLQQDFEEPEDEVDGSDPVDPDGDLLEDDPTANQNLGADTAETYRLTLAAVENMDPDDEMQTWDAYLAKYPSSAFRPQIEKRMAQLEDELYDMNRIRRTDPEPAIDADEAQLKFSQGLLIENLNPRQRLQLTLEWGLPDYANLGIDYEHPLSRAFSVHAGLRRRFTGVNLEGGVHWALVKSARTNTLVTFIGDVHLNTIPAFIGFRPQLAVGKRFGKVDLQAQAGVDISPRAQVDLRVLGGVNATYRASNAVGLFAETSLYMKTLSGDSGPYRFNQFTFGMKFYPSQKARDPEKTEVNLGASVPYTSAYWQFHYGSLMGQANFYLD